MCLKTLNANPQVRITSRQHSRKLCPYKTISEKGHHRFFPQILRKVSSAHQDQKNNQ